MRKSLWIIPLLMCLTVASGEAALAGTITYTEGTSPAPADFANTFGTASLLTAAAFPGTTIVNASVDGSNPVDFFELTGLGTGTFIVGATALSGAGVITVLTDADAIIEGPSAFAAGGTSFGGVAIPATGNLIIEIEDVGTGSTSYTVTVDTLGSVTPTPEPGTVGLMLIGFVLVMRKL